MVEYNLVKGLFWRLNLPVRQSVWRTLLWVSVTPRGLSHSHSCSGTKGRGSSLIGWHLLQVFPAHASSTWRIARQRGLPRHHRLKEYGTGAARVGGSSVWQMLRRGAKELMGGVERWNFADSAEAEYVFGTETVCNSSASFTGEAPEACEQWSVAVSNCYFKKVSQLLVTGLVDTIDKT